MFKEPEVIPPDECDITFHEPDEEGLVQFLCVEKGFNEERIRGGIAKLKASKKKSSQSRITNFFTLVPQTDKPKTPKKSKQQKEPKEKSVKTTPKKNIQTKKEPKEKTIKKEPSTTNLKRKRDSTQETSTPVDKKIKSEK